MVEEERLRVGHRGEQFAGRIGSEHEDDGGERITVSGAGVDDGGLQHAFDGPHAARIEDVTVAMTIFDKEFFGAGSGGE